MNTILNGIWLGNFKSYKALQKINISDLSVLLGANSSGKSSVLQALLLIKQTVECNSADINLLLSGKYVYLGDFQDILYDPDNPNICIGVSTNAQSELGDSSEKQILWFFTKTDESERIVLDKIEIRFNEETVSFKHDKNLDYRILVNNENTPWITKIQNLKVNSFYAQYEKDLNILFSQFLNSLLHELIGTKKTDSIRKDIMVSYYGENDFCIILYNTFQNAFSTEENNQECTNKIVHSITDLINRFRQLQIPYSSFLDDIIVNKLKPIIINNAVYNYLKRVQNSDTIDDIISKYTQLLDNYIEEKKADTENHNCYLKESIRFDYTQGTLKGEELYSDKFMEALKTYRSFITEFIEKIFYLGPIREKPQGLYNIGFESIPKYVGVTGAYFASVLLHEKEKIHQYILPEGSDETELLEAVDVWANHLNIASQINVNKNISFGYSVSVHNTQNKEASIMNVGIGTSQVLPVLICGLVSAPGEILLFEQPELHLHPFSQSRLADFFVALALNGRKILVETHSEYLILRLRYHVLAGHIKPNQIAVNFFENNDGTIVKEGKLDVYGNLQYPSDFKDETQKLLDELLNVAMKKGHNYGKKHFD